MHCATTKHTIKIVNLCIYVYVVCVSIYMYVYTFILIIHIRFMLLLVLLLSQNLPHGVLVFFMLFFT